MDATVYDLFSLLSPRSILILCRDYWRIDTAVVRAIHSIVVAISSLERKDRVQGSSITWVVSVIALWLKEQWALWNVSRAMLKSSRKPEEIAFPYAHKVYPTSKWTS